MEKAVGPKAGRMITPHFSWQEARCRCGCEIPEELYPNIVQMAQAAERVRAEVGGPMFVTSWYRCPEYNAKVGGAPNSLHMKGLAMDFVAKNMPPRLVQEICVRLQARGVIGGLGRYEGHTHIDLGPKRIWWGVSK
jgi:uncharacterized protein YcbK (DUF882 family)